MILVYAFLLHAAKQQSKTQISWNHFSLGFGSAFFFFSENLFVPRIFRLYCTEKEKLRTADDLIFMSKWRFHWRSHFHYNFFICTELEKTPHYSPPTQKAQFGLFNRVKVLYVFNYFDSVDLKLCVIIIFFFLVSWDCWNPNV